MSLSLMYGLRLFVVVVQELHCLPNNSRDVALVGTEFCQFAFANSTVSETCKSKLKNNNNNEENI